MKKERRSFGNICQCLLLVISCYCLGTKTGWPVYVSPRGLALKTKAQLLFPSHKFLGIFSGSKQVNAIRGVCGGDCVKRVVYS